MKHVQRHGDNMVSTFEEFADGTCEARLFYRWDDDSWRPPLPPDVELPIGTGRAVSQHRPLEL